MQTLIRRFSSIKSIKNLLDYFNKINRLDTYMNEFYEILNWSSDLWSLCLKYRAKWKIDNQKIVTEIINNVKKKEISTLSEVIKIIWNHDSERDFFKEE